MSLLTVSIITCALAAGPAVMFAVNLYYYRRPPAFKPSDRPSVSVLIPARNEEKTIGAAVESVLNSEGVTLEVIVLDDHSEDATADVVRTLAESDDRVRLETAPPLPDGWNGKQHACSVLSRKASFPLLVFMDADVRVQPDGLRRVAGFLHRSDAGLISGFPAEITDTWAEKLVIPLMQFVLLGFLPIWLMRTSCHPAFAAGCGQFFMARREAYDATGGHRAIKQSRADGLTLPRAFRQAGLKTDIFDGTELMECHMCGGFREVWSGIAKNATEEMAAPARIGPFTVLLLGGQVLPFALLPAALLTGQGAATAVCFGAVGMALACRLVAVGRFNQSLLGALLHPVGVSLLMGIQWYALIAAVLGQPTRWKGRNPTR